MLIQVRWVLLSIIIVHGIVHDDLLLLSETDWLLLVESDLILRVLFDHSTRFVGQLLFGGASTHVSVA